LSTIINIDKKK